MRAYIYAHFKASKAASQGEKMKINAKSRLEELNCYQDAVKAIGVT
jgi:hypothetical protein